MGHAGMAIRVQKPAQAAAMPSRYGAAASPPAHAVDILCVAMYFARNSTEHRMAPTHENPLSKLELELRRGALVLAVLSQLRSAQYGYSLRQALAQRGMPIEEGTLYPLLRRLEKQGLLASEWRIDDGPPRRYYHLNDAGEALLANLTTVWSDLVATMGGLLKGAEHEHE